MESALSGAALETQCRVATSLSRSCDCSSSFATCGPRNGRVDPSQRSVHQQRLPHLSVTLKLHRRRSSVAALVQPLTSSKLGSLSFGDKACDRWGLLGQAVSSEGRGRRRVKNGRGKVAVYNALASSFPSVTKTERTLALPIDYYQILGAETHFLADGIVRAYDARLAHPPREGFSHEALLARVEILRGARDTLADPEWRGDYNQGLMEDEAGTLVVDVPWSKVSGALCLLQEVGELETVLEAGLGLLDERLPKAMRRDVVLSVALAYVELSREAMGEAVPSIVRSCDLLETALKLLQEEGGSSLGPLLQEQIEETLEELSPRCVLELLASSMDKERETQREEGLQGLKSILWSVGEGGAAAPIRGFTREQFIKEAFSLLTASEQVSLWEATPDNVPAESFEVYVVAMAHVVEGFAAKKPILIVKADELFWQLQATLESENNAAAPLDYSLERAVCRLLLGEVDQSMACLGLQEGQEDLRDPAVIDFIYAHSEGSEEGDLLPGLCKLLENWLGEVAFPTFRDTENLQVRLGDYYDDPQVINILEAWETTKGGSSSALSRIGAALDSVKVSAVQTLQKVFPLGRQSGPDQRTSAASGSSAPGEYGWGSSEVGGGAPGVSSLKNNGAARSASKSDLSPVQIACSGILFGVLVLAGLRFWPFRHSSANLVGSSPSVSVASPSSGAVEEQQQQAMRVTKMDARLAEHMVRKWQTAKAQALGATHAVAHLSEILEGKMLESWTDRVNEVARNGWYWEYRLVGLNIDSVTVSVDGRKAIVEATLQEAARLFDSEKPEHKDSYRSTYTTRYELQWVRDDWKITGGVVLRS